MPVLSSELIFKYSVTSGVAGNSVAQTNPNASLGKYVSTTQWYGTTLHDLFDLITAVENGTNQVDYRCVFLHNSSQTGTLASAVVWIASQVAGGADIAIGVDTNAPSIVSSTGTQAVTAADVISAPVGITFSTPTSQGAALLLGTLPPNYVVPIWMRRTANNSPALINDGVTLQIQGSTF